MNTEESPDLIEEELHFCFGRRLFLSILSIAILKPSILYAQNHENLEYAAKVKLFVNVKERKINTAVLGVCLMHPPFNAFENILKKWRGRSVRVWAHSERKWWNQLLPALNHIAPETLLLFNEAAWHPEQIIYHGLTENNLNSNQKPDAVVVQMKFALTLLESAQLAKKALFWEAWNEPQFPQNGNWEPEAMARYVNDIARAVDKEGLPFRILAPLHMNPNRIGREWNDRLCQGLDPHLIAGLVNHYYNWGWFDLDQPRDEFLRRAGDGPLLRERVRQDRALIDRYGQGNWTLHCSEWNVHPKTYRPPYHVSRDMAAALYAFSAIKIYLEEGLDSAQLFLLASRDRHFAAYTLENGVVISRPTGTLMEWLGEKMHGELLMTNVDCPTFSRKSEYGLSNFDVPFLEVIASRSATGIKLLLANKDPLRSATVVLEGVSGKILNAELLTAKGDNRDISEEVKLDLGGGLRIPPASILAVVF